MSALRVRRGDDLQPFDAASRCPKCLGEDVGVNYHEPPTCGNADCSVCEPEHIRRCCRRCHFEWAEAPADASGEG